MTPIACGSRSWVIGRGIVRGPSASSGPGWPGSDQFALPDICMTAGTRIVRRMNASSATAAARPTPNSATFRLSVSENAANTQVMIYNLDSRLGLAREAAVGSVIRELAESHCGRTGLRVCFRTAGLGA
jgi:hypothetical protein